MSKKTLSLFVAGLLVAIALSLSQEIRSPILSILHKSSNLWFDAVHSVDDLYSEHFQQVETIERLREDLREYQESHIVAHQIATEYNALLLENSSQLNPKAESSLVRTISYANFGDINKLWLDMDDFNSSKIYALVYGDKAAGIVIQRESRPLALLNGDLKCTYAVFVGDNYAPGIAKGQNSDKMSVEYIPIWTPISVGDEVVTSGLDGLFLRGIKVGKVVEITLSRGYQKALVELYYKGNDPDYFHIIRR